MQEIELRSQSKREFLDALIKGMIDNGAGLGARSCAVYVTTNLLEKDFTVFSRKQVKKVALELYKEFNELQDENTVYDQAAFRAKEIITKMAKACGVEVFE